MKYTMVRLFVAAICCAMSASANTASAGFGLLQGGGSSGGAYGGYGSSGGASYSGYGSSGGYASSYGSSGGGSSGGYGSSGGATYGSSGGGASSGGTAGPGPVRRFAARMHDHIHAKFSRAASYGSSGGSSGGSAYAGYGSSGGSSGYSTSYGSSGYSTSYGSSGYSTSYGSSGYSTSYGSTGSYGSAGSVIAPGAVAPYTSGYLGVSNQAPATAARLAAYRSDASDAVYLSVNVPASAKVFVNNLPTTSTGASRQFISRGLNASKKYKFEVRAEILGADGQLATESQSITLAAGERNEITFNTLSDTPVQTAVTLNVPADAKVILAGNETNASGEKRTYRTAQLKAGQQWEDYVVEVHHAGVIKRETLRLVAGDDVALTFNFDDDTSLVASR